MAETAKQFLQNIQKRIGSIFPGQPVSREHYDRTESAPAPIPLVDKESLRITLQANADRKTEEERIRTISAKLAENLPELQKLKCSETSPIKLDPKDEKHRTLITQLSKSLNVPENSTFEIAQSGSGIRITSRQDGDHRITSELIYDSASKKISSFKDSNMLAAESRIGELVMYELRYPLIAAKLSPNSHEKSRTSPDAAENPQILEMELKHQKRIQDILRVRVAGAIGMDVAQIKTVELKSSQTGDKIEETVRINTLKADGRDGDVLNFGRTLNRQGTTLESRQDFASFDARSLLDYKLTKQGAVPPTR